MPQSQENTKPLVSADELEALIRDWGAGPFTSVDRFFPARFWYIFVTALVAAIWLLFNTQNIAQTLTTDPEHAQLLRRYLYFRGWFLVIAVAVGCYSYFRNWYVGIVFSAFLLISITNLVSDLFIVYPERLANPKPLFTLQILIRISSLWVIYMTIKNASRLPALKDRANILLPFKRDPNP